MSTRTNRQRGFTLLEIMIVIVLIGIVATIALPNFLEAEAQAEAASLQQDVDTVRKAWIQLLSGESVQITDPILEGADTGFVSHNRPVQGSAPAPLAPFLTTLKSEGQSVEVYDLDASGKPQIARDASGKPTGIMTQTVSIPQLVGPRKIWIKTRVIKKEVHGQNSRGAGSSASLFVYRLGLPNYSIQIHLTAPTTQADELLRLSIHHFKEAGFTVDYKPPAAGSGGGFAGLQAAGQNASLTLYFVP